MNEIRHLQRAEFDKIMQSNQDMILLFYKKNDAYSSLGIDTMNEVERLIGRSFELYLIDAESEPDIVHAFSVKKVPEYISMKNCKIFKRSSHILSPSEVLALLKESF